VKIWHWAADTLVNVWSTTKGVTAACFAMLADRGGIDLAAPVARYWPEFAAAGKQDVTVAMLLSHQAGLCGFRNPALMEDFYDAEAAALANPLIDPLAPNHAAWRAAEIPSANGFATARGLARLYGALAHDGRLDGQRLVAPEVIARATAEQISGLDAVLSVEASWGCGFLRNSTGVYGPNSAAFGHSGWGGSFAFADPDSRIGMAYTMNRMGTDLMGDPRNMALIAAVYASL
jgi:CubicO group peptidase (beta-lactamase class C family)